LSDLIESVVVFTVFLFDKITEEYLYCWLFLCGRGQMHTICYFALNA